MKISIMIPTYNQQQYIADAIESALMQDYADLEVIVADDCSSDDTGIIASRYKHDDRFLYVRNERNLGRVDNYRHTLYNHVSGAWFVNLDGDDYYTNSGFISEAVNDISGAEKLSDRKIVAYLAGHDLDVIGPDISYARVSDSVLLISGLDYFLDYVKIGRFAHMASIFNVEAAKIHDFYSYDSFATDFHSMMKLVIDGNVLLSSCKPGVWRMHGGNATALHMHEKYIESVGLFEDLAMYARTVCDASVVDAWMSSASKVAYHDYIASCCHYGKGMQNFLTVLKAFSFDRHYLRSLLYLLSRNVFR